VKATRREQLARLADVLEAVEAIRSHVGRGRLDDPLIFDAVRMRLVEIGEAVGAIPEELLATEPEIPWREIVAMRHKLVHHYYDAALGIMAATVSDDLPVLEAAVGRLRVRIAPAG
jgi:uncharacterized protein with HEPN domain